MSDLKRIYRYFGMCGTLKATSIKALMKSRIGYTLPVWSLPKPWKRLESGVLEGYIQKGNNMNLAALTLCTLENTLMTASIDPDIDFILCERGVLDNLWYWKRAENKSLEEVEPIVKKILEEEKRISNKYGFEEFRYTILLMLDEEFIENKVIPEPTRRAWFPDVKSYLQAQEDYYNFFEHFYLPGGKLRVRRIENAREFIENKLKLPYED